MSSRVAEQLPCSVEGCEEEARPYSVGYVLFDEDAEPVMAVSWFCTAHATWYEATLVQAAQETGTRRPGEEDRWAFRLLEDQEVRHDVAASR